LESGHDGWHWVLPRSSNRDPLTGGDNPVTMVAIGTVRVTAVTSGSECHGA